LQDYTGDDFDVDENSKPKGLLARTGFLDDPKIDLYQQYKEIPKQTLNVNTNKASDYHPDNYQHYFTYPLLNFIFDDTKHRLSKENTIVRKHREKFQVCLNELFLKDLVFNKKPVSCADYTLPCFPEWHVLELPLMPCWNEKLKEYVFIHKNSLLHIVDNIIQIVTPQNPEYLNLRKEILKTRNIAWNDIVREFRCRYFLENKEEEDVESRLEKAFFIIGKNLVIEIEELEERLLYNYEAIEQKKAKGTSARGKDEIEGAQYIWYHKEENTYSIGSPQSPQQTQDKAIKLRRFDIYQGENLFDGQLLLELMAVQFVRNKQYTVYPYPFDLIRLYCENENY